jgi:hypothetical protein
MFHYIPPPEVSLFLMANIAHALQINNRCIHTPARFVYSLAGIITIMVSIGGISEIINGTPATILTGRTL